ncbi:MAG TPA: acyltransferase [Rhizomicrobium sp.]|nr:acyltransferase [Rhizomicrobium sp.]
MPDKASRNHGFDALRVIAAAAVVLLHSTAAPDVPRHSSHLVILQTACRFAVPFFFIASGYFQRDVTRFDFKLILQPLKRLLPLYIFWTVAYDLIFLMQYDVATLTRYNFNAAYHLWFLPALGAGLVLLQAGRAFFGLRLVTVLAIALALIGLASTSYADLLGLENHGGRRGWLFALSFLVMGAWLARTKYSPSLKIAVSTIILGYGCSIAEEYFLASSSGHGEYVSHDFLFSTFPFGLGIAFFAIWLGKSASRTIIKLSAFGSLSLGIYLSHLLWLWAFTPLVNPNSFAGIAALAVATFTASAALAALLARTPTLNRLAT